MKKSFFELYHKVFWLGLLGVALCLAAEKLMAQTPGYLVTIETPQARKPAVHRVTNKAFVDTLAARRLNVPYFDADSVLCGSRFFDASRENMYLYIEKGMIKKKRNGKTVFRKLKKRKR